MVNSSLKDIFTSLIAGILLCGIFALSSCKGSDKKVLAEATGRIDEILVVTHDSYLKDDIGKAMKAMLRKSYPGLPQDEPYFDAHFVPYRAFNRLLEKTSTILFVCPLDEDTPVNEYLRKQKARVSQDLSGKHFFSFGDVWAEGQQVFFVYGETREDLIAFLNKQSPQFIKAIKRIEDQKAYRNVVASGVDAVMTNSLVEAQNIRLEIPRTFREVQADETIAWFRQDLEGAIENLMIKTVPIAGATGFDKMLPIYVRDEMGKLVSTEKEYSHMVTDTMMNVSQKMIKIDGRDCIETRGLWEMTEDFMGGPFINYCVKDEENDRFVIMDYFVYAPQFKKRQYIRKMEVFLPNAELDPTKN